MYRIYTEDKNVSEVTAIVSKYFDGFTMFQGIGCWKGTLEKSLVIEISASGRSEQAESKLSPTIGMSRFPFFNAVEMVAREIKEFNRQESVLIVHIKEESNFI